MPDAQTPTIRTTGREHITALVARSRKKLSAHDRSTVLHQLIAQYAALPADAAPLAYEVRQAFLRTLEHVPAILTDEAVTRFLADHIEPEDFAELQWQSPSAVVAYCELLYQFRFASDAMAQHVQALERNLLRYALQQYERQGAYEKMFQLLKLAPTAPALSDAELQRLRNRAYLYEHRRVRRRRRWLYAYLLLQVVLIVGVFPVVFMAAESGVLQQQVKAVSGIELPPEPHRVFSYGEGLYWSLITAASIGYGDITPLTGIGKLSAVTLGVLGVITVGVIAGLILDWMAQRSLD